MRFGFWLSMAKGLKLANCFAFCFRPVKQAGDVGATLWVQCCARHLVHLAEKLGSWLVCREQVVALQVGFECLAGTLRASTLDCWTAKASDGARLTQDILPRRLADLRGPVKTYLCWMVSPRRFDVLPRVPRGIVEMKAQKSITLTSHFRFRQLHCTGGAGWWSAVARL